MLSHAQGCMAHAHEASLLVQTLQFSTLFQSLFHLVMPWNFKWFFFTLYCLQMSSKNHWTSIFISLILHLMSCFVGLHDFSEMTQNTYGVVWIRIKLNCNDLNEKNTKNSSKHWQFLNLTSNLFLNANKITKNIAKNIICLFLKLLQKCFIVVNCMVYDYDLTFVLRVMV